MSGVPSEDDLQHAHADSRRLLTSLETGDGCSLDSSVDDIVDQVDGLAVGQSPTHGALIETSALAKHKRRRERLRQRNEQAQDEEPLIDTTEALPLHSKRLDRRQKRQEEKNKRRQAKQALSSIFRLPAELLLQVLCLLEPTDVLRTAAVNHDLQAFVQEQDFVISKAIIRQRYLVLSQSFPQPVLLSNVDPAAHPALLNTKRQNMLAIHKKPYQHIPVIDMHEFCTCMSCVFAWNNLCVILDSAHWQGNLDRREPIPMIPRGSSPQWNEDLLTSHADIVRRSLKSQLTYAAILQKHLQTINKALRRREKWHKSPDKLYDATDRDYMSGSDAYLERCGPSSYEFPFHRDNYYNMEAYVPNRKWSKDSKTWLYYSGSQHERDLAWTMTHFSLSP